MIYNIVPVPKPRMTRRDSWKGRPCVKRYYAFKDEVKLHKVDVQNGDTIVFYVPMPKSWGKKKKAEMEFTAHQQTPDVDNLCKALLDAVFGNDSHIWDIRIIKMWHTHGCIEIRR